MKKFLSIALSGFLALTLVGCRASAEVDPDTDHDTSHTSYKKTTTYDNGDRTTKTEVKTER